MIKKKKRIKKKRKKVRFNYLAQGMKKYWRNSSFIHNMFKEYGVSLERLEHVHIKTLVDTVVLSETTSLENGYYRISIDYKLAILDFFNLLVHETVHLLRMITNTQTNRETYWNYEHDPEEHECMLWEMKWLKERGVDKAKMIKHFAKGVVSERYPPSFLELLWELEKI